MDTTTTTTEKFTTEPTEKHRLIDQLIVLNAKIGADKKQIKYFDDTNPHRLKNLSNIMDDDIRNYDYDDCWENEDTINELRLRLANNLRERAEVRKQLNTKVVDFLSRSTANSQIKSDRSYVKGHLHADNKIKGCVVESVIANCRGKNGSGTSRYEIQFEILTAPKMDTQIISIYFDSVDEAVAALKLMKDTLGDLVIFVRGHVSANFNYSDEAVVKDVVAANDRLALEIYALESEWVR